MTVSTSNSRTNSAGLPNGAWLLHALTAAMIGCGPAATPSGQTPADAASPDGGGRGVRDAEPVPSPDAVVCEPTLEVCDGLDNDCNGVADDGFETGKPCSAGVGACASEGVITCGDDGAATCTAQASAPTVERCDGLDNDCDGQVDNGFDLGTACQVGVGACGAEGTIVCDASGQGTCSVQAGAPVAETCDGEDDDCDGQVDNGFALGEACTVGTGACGATGALVCDDAGGARCDATPGLPADEVCDAVDNDCDGQVDEGLRLGELCRVGVGACGATGQLVCDPSGGVVCDAIAGEPAAETCDAVDNDCDGVVDNGLQLGSACTQGVGACAAAGALECDGQGGVRCSARAGAPAAEVCDSVDNDCDGSVDDGLGLGDACSVGTGACAQAGRVVCGAESRAVCDATPGSPSAEVCDALDNDCNGVIDDGVPVGAACSAGVGACARSGRLVCGANGATVCDAVPAQPGLELCDAVDNDCNGVIDDGLGLGTRCTSGIGACAREGVFVCAGNGSVACNAIPGSPSLEECDGADNDCDGQVDDGLVDQGEPCYDGRGACVAIGTFDCRGEQGWSCDVVTLPPQNERCDAIDNDCDGLVDDSACQDCQAAPLERLEIDIVRSGQVSGPSDLASVECATGRTAITPEAVFEFTTPYAGYFSFSTSGSVDDTVLYLRSGVCDPTDPRAFEKACNDDTGGSSSSEILAYLQSGERVFVVVDFFTPNLLAYRFSVSVSAACPSGIQGDGVCDEQGISGRPSGVAYCIPGLDPIDCSDAPVCGSAFDGYCDEASRTCARFTDGEDCARQRDCPAGWVGDGECDEPGGTGLCAYGTDPVDCSVCSAARIGDGVCDEPEGTGRCGDGVDRSDCLCDAAPVLESPLLDVVDFSALSALSGTCAERSSLWPERVYRFVAPEAGLWAFDTIVDPADETDTVLYLLAGACSLPDAVELACNDDFTLNDRGSGVEVRLSAGQTIFVVVDFYEVGAGVFDLSASRVSN